MVTPPSHSNQLKPQTSAGQRINSVTPLRFEEAQPSGWREYLLVAGVIAALTGAGLLLPESYYVQVGLLYLLAINLLSLRVGRAPILTAGILAAFCWDFLFVPPYFNFAIYNLEDILLLITYFVVALVAGQLTARIRAQARNERLRQERATALFQFTRVLAEAKTLDEAANMAVRHMNDLLGVQTALVFTRENTLELEPPAPASFAIDGNELQSATTALSSRQSVGRFTEVQSNAVGYYLPLVREEQVFGVLGIKIPPGKILTNGQKELLEAFSQQLALMIERARLRAAGEREKLLAESEKLHRALLESVSHELRTPLAVIMATCDKFSNYNSDNYAGFVAEIRTAGMRLTHLVGNLLDQTRLDSGPLKPHLDWCDPRDLINAALRGAAGALVNHPLEIMVSDDMPLVRIDFALAEHMLVNLLLNAALHTPAGTPVSIIAGLDAASARVFFAVADRGPGFPALLREQLFKKFVRGEAAPSGGLGLGLSIVRGFTLAQGGEVVLGDNPGGGAKITLYLPHFVAKNSPPE